MATELFVPFRHRFQLPANTDKMTEREKTSTFRYKEIAWIMYWHWVEREARKNDCGLMDARNLVHAQGTVPERHENDYDNNVYWHTDDYLCEFMMQFEAWQAQSYNVHRMVGRDRHRGTRYNWYDVYKLIAEDNEPPTLDTLISLLSYGSRGNLVSHLCVVDRWDDVRMLSRDPIYGHECDFELESKKWSDEHKASETERKALLHPNIKAIDGLIAKMGPSNYNVIFPYPINQFHSVANCLCVMADGSPIFRLQVLDPDTCTQFVLAELMSPWWGGYELFQKPGPGEGQYDFPFHDFDLTPGNQFDYAKLIEVIEAGVEQVNARHNIQCR